MSDKIITHVANAVLGLAAAAVALLAVKALQIEPSRFFWEVLLAIVLAEGLMTSVAAILIPRYMKWLRRPRVNLVPLYGFHLARAENGHPRGTLRLGLRNNGDAPLNTYRWHLFIPAGLRPELTMRDGDRTINIGTRKIRGYEYATGRIAHDPILPKTTNELPLSVRLESTRSDRSEWKLRYAISTEYGQFPSTSERHEKIDAGTIPDCAPLTLKVE
jgi:hypothetical protein